MAFLQQGNPQGFSGQGLMGNQDPRMDMNRQQGMDPAQLLALIRMMKGQQGQPPMMSVSQPGMGMRRPGY